MNCNNSVCKNPITEAKLCRHCLLSRYCSNECRIEDWNSGHKQVCNSNSYSLKDFLPVKSSRSLGKGAYGEVQLVQQISSRKHFALKVIKKKNLSRSSTLKMMYQEISVQKKLIHPNIIRLFGHIEDIDTLYLVLEYAEKGNLFHYVCIGINYLHENSIIHRDLKPENILITQKNQAKICDFGWCAEGNTERSTYCGTLDYMAPEILKGYNYTNKVDIWALGVLLFEMSHGSAPFNAKSDIEKSRLIRQGNFKFDENVSHEIKDLITEILQDVPEKRPTILQILKHPWIQKFMKSVYAEKIDFLEFQCGNTIKDYEYGDGIIVGCEGLVCEISYSIGTLPAIIPEFVRKNEVFSLTASTISSLRTSQFSNKNELSVDKEFEMKLSKNYPPSYGQSPLSRKGQSKNESIKMTKVKHVESQENSLCNSPSISHLNRSDGTFGSVASSSSSKFSSSSREMESSHSIVPDEVIINRTKELENLQLALEASRKQPIAPRRKKKKSGFFSRISEIFNIGCTDR